MVLKVILITALAAGAARLLLPSGNILAFLLAPMLYIPLAFLTGAVKLSELHGLLRSRTAVA